VAIGIHRSARRRPRVSGISNLPDCRSWRKVPFDCESPPPGGIRIAGGRIPPGSSFLRKIPGLGIHRIAIRSARNFSGRCSRGNFGRLHKGRCIEGYEASFPPIHLVLYPVGKDSPWGTLPPFISSTLDDLVKSHQAPPSQEQELCRGENRGVGQGKKGGGVQ
jgi:hypothetical protein